MRNARAVWSKPTLVVLGDVQTLTKQGRPCAAAVMKGHGTGDTFSNSTPNNPNPNNGCASLDGASGF